MSELRSLLDQMSLDDDVSVEVLRDQIVELAFCGQMIEVLIADRIRALTRRGGHHRLGHPSPTALLAHEAGMSVARARRVVSRAQAESRAPEAYRAWADGRITTDQATVLFRAAEAVPDSYPQAESLLVEVVAGLSASDTVKAVEYWRQSVDGPGEVDVETQLARRGVSISKTMGGMRRIDGWLTQSAGEALETALDALIPPPVHGERRTPRQRRHDALEDLARDWLDHADTPQTGGERPHIMLLTDLDALRGIAGGTHETLNGDIVDVDTLRQTACDASISRIVLGPNSEILDIGRKTRVWTAAQRRAIIARDRHCQAPGCRRPPRWCDIHHTDHWTDGGHTSVDKGVLLCRFHHTREHLKEKWRRRG